VTLRSTAFTALAAVAMLASPAAAMSISTALEYCSGVALAALLPPVVV
jgi:hypothetical protein